MAAERFFFQTHSEILRTIFEHTGLRVASLFCKCFLGPCSLLGQGLYMEISRSSVDQVKLL